VSAAETITPDDLEQRLDTTAQLVRIVATYLASEDGTEPVDMAGALDTIASMATAMAGEVRGEALR
jgi:hypothetical protein